MSITPEERKEIIEEAVQKTLLMIPEVMGNLMTNHASLHKLNSEFYKKYPEFKEHKEVVVSVVEMLEGKNPLMEYDEILKTAVPDIKKRIEIKKSVSVEPVLNPSRDFSKIDMSNGEL